MSHARAVAEVLDNVEADEDGAEEYSCERDGERIAGTLRELLQDVAQRTLDLIAAGGLLSTRYNYLTNFGWFGVSVWKVIVDAEVALVQLREASDVEMDGIDDDVLHIKALLIEFLHAHQEDPTKLRPKLYWYGQEYSYLTRDMIDLSVKLIGDVNAQIDRVGQSIPPMEIPDLLAGTAQGRFLEYPQCRASGAIFEVAARDAFWPGGWRLRSGWGRKKKKLLEREADPIRRREAGWHTWLDWGRRTLDIFDIRVDIYFDPHFEAIVRDLGADAEDRRLIFLPTHQSLFDHPVLYRVLQSREFLNAMGWERPEPCVILARTGLSRSGIKIGSKQITQFGMTSEVFDQILEHVDGYVMLERSPCRGPYDAARGRGIDRAAGRYLSHGDDRGFCDSAISASTRRVCTVAPRMW